MRSAQIGVFIFNKINYPPNKIIKPGAKDCVEKKSEHSLAL